MTGRMSFRVCLAALSVAMVWMGAVTDAPARGIRAPLQATITTQLYEGGIPSGPMAVRPLSDTVENEQLIGTFEEAVENLEREIVESAPLVVEFNGEIIWDYRPRSTLASQHLNANLENRSSAFSASQNRDFTVLGQYEHGDVRLPTYRLTVEIRQGEEVVWSGQALSNPTSLAQDQVMELMVPPLMELLEESVEGEIFPLE